MTQELESRRDYVHGVGLVNPKSFGVCDATKVYRKLQTGDSRSATVSIPIAWTKLWKDSKLCGYVRMTRNPDSSILLEGV